MIDHVGESLVTFPDAAKILPRRRQGKKTSVTTLYRWSTVGCRGIRLETIQIGATRCTSKEALQRFFERLSQPEQIDAARQALPALRTPTQRERASTEAGRKLAELGV